MNKHDAIKVASTCLTYQVASLLLLSFTAHAGAAVQDINRIEQNSLNNLSGIVGVNMAAGDNNIQANNTSIAIGDYAKTNIRSSAKNSNNNQTQDNNIQNNMASVRIEANTLQNASGLISINQVAGNNNIQINDIGIAFGKDAQVMSDLSLSVRANNQDDLIAKEDNVNKSVYLDKNSLNGASGTIQVNQIAGNGNIAVNRVSMPIR